MRSDHQRVRLHRLRFLGILAAFLTFSCATCGASDADGPADGMFHWTISTVVEVDAPPPHVWSVLVDLPAYREWNPFIVEAAGKVAVGEELQLRMALPGREPMSIKPRLLVVEPERELRWKGRLVVPGLFDGEHAFVLTPLENGRTRVDHWERFAGVLLPIARGMVYEATVQSFHALNAALAKRAGTRNPGALGESGRADPVIFLTNQQLLDPGLDKRSQHHGSGCSDSGVTFIELRAVSERSPLYLPRCSRGR